VTAHVRERLARDLYDLTGPSCQAGGQDLVHVDGARHAVLLLQLCRQLLERLAQMPVGRQARP
jgi:hypothetical protein